MIFSVNNKYTMFWGKLLKGASQVIHQAGEWWKPVHNTISTYAPKIQSLVSSIASLLGEDQIGKDVNKVIDYGVSNVSAQIPEVADRVARSINDYGQFLLGT
jgi:ABC-type dipeptide/oligopeptide/nickel transport system permease subunit